ncbi:ABC transporter substrate-binding protein [Ahrensia kielensis]|uniref:ABC transporter substrate-binding protein n=1 Tax=Ahrensia kielensis TaxID=76980 RepID=A0ABU9T236_9HYPH
MPYFRIFALLRTPKTFSIACSSITLVLFAITILSGQARATDKEAKRVLAIGGAVTEIIYALGQEDRLVGRDSTSLYPQEATALPDVGYIRALSPEGVLSVRPDLILARENNGPKEAVDVIKSTGMKWVDVPDNFTIEGIDDNIRIIAEELGVSDKGDALRAKVASEIAEARKKSDNKDKPKVMFILSVQDGKINASGTKTAAHGIIELAGGVNVISAYEGYKQLSDEAVIDAAPEVIVMMNGRGDHSSGNSMLEQHAALSTTPAVKNGAIIRMDGLLMLGFGPRTGEAISKLSTAIHRHEF